MSREKDSFTQTNNLIGTIRLNRYLAQAGITSRRKADDLIKIGTVEINGKIVTDLGYRVLSQDRVKFEGRLLHLEKKVYYILNKPKGFLTTVYDEKKRKTVMALVPKVSVSRLYPIGRLDRQTTGVLLLTNDGDLSKKMTHPSYKIKKIYHVVLNMPLQNIDLEKIRSGIYLSEGKVQVDMINYIKKCRKNVVSIELHLGWNRIIHRIFKTLKYKVVLLDRVLFGGLTKKKLQTGQCRMLTNTEVNHLKMIAY